MCVYTYTYIYIYICMYILSLAGDEGEAVEEVRGVEEAVRHAHLL